MQDSHDKRLFYATM